jgi:hypothetical protein
MEGSRKLRIHILFNGDKSWTVAHRQIKFGTAKDDRHSFTWVLLESLFHLTKILNMAMVKNNDVILGQTQPLWVEFCNFVQCNILLIKKITLKLYILIL